MAVVYLFDEILFDPTIFTAGDASGGPEYDNSLIRNPPTGVYKVNVTRFDFQHVWTFDIHLLSYARVEYLMKIWVGGLGSAYGLRVRLFSDFYVIGQVLGISDGTVASKTWKLVRSFTRPGTGRTFDKRCIKPVVNTNLASGNPTLVEADGVTTRVIPSTDAAANGVPAFRVMLNGVVQTSGYTVDNTTGTVVFTSAPANGTVVSWSGEYDTPMRFLQNTLGLKADVASEVKGVQMVEILPAELGIT